MYKLVITFGSGPSRKIESKSYWMTVAGLHSAEIDFEALKEKQIVMKLQLWRQDIHGTFELKRWERHGEQ
jgi:hypothetical protein